MPKIKDYIDSSNKKVFYLIAIVIGLFIIGREGFHFIDSQPKSLSEFVKVTYSGYDGYGTLSYNYDDVAREVTKLAMKKAGFSTKDAEAIAKGDNVILAKINSNPSQYSKLSEGYAMASSVSYKFDKTTDLLNGDEVSFIVSSTTTSSPVKVEETKFKVSDLKTVDKISTKKLLEEYPIKFVGYNGYGAIKFGEDNGISIYTLTDENSDLSSSSKLRNGEKLKIKVNESYINTLLAKGKGVEESQFEIEVTGLPEISDISNLSEAFSSNDTYAKSLYENSSYYTYSIEPQSSYIGYNIGYSSYGSSSSSLLYAITIYKITETPTSGDVSVNYRYVGYSYYTKSDGSLDLEAKTKVSGSTTKDLENLISSLKSDGYKEYKQKSE